MSDSRNSELVLTLAEVLMGSQVDTAAVSKALQLICDYGSFDCGMIYEADGAARFHLMEHYAPEPMEFCEHFSHWTFAGEDVREMLARDVVTCMQRSEENLATEKTLLDSFGAEQMLFAPVSDEEWNFYGMLVLVHKTEREQLPEGEKRVLFLLISMLMRYVEVRMYQNKVSMVRTALENILDNTGIDIYVNDFNTHEVLYVNKSMAAPYGGQAQFKNRKCWQVLFPGQTGPCDFCPQKKLVDEHGAPSRVYSWDYQRPFDGSWFRVFSTAFQWSDGRLAHVVSSADISENKRNEALIAYMANYDELTKLPNRRMLIQECKRRINGATATEQGYVLFFDIDGFKAVNDCFGHDAGDEFLVELGQFFSSIPMLKDSIYRNGGDEFVAVIGGEAVTKDNIRNLVGFIHARFQRPWVLKSGEALCNTSVGVACYPEDGMDAETLLQKADMAMYQIKKKGGAGLCFGYELE